MRVLFVLVVALFSASDAAYLISYKFPGGNKLAEYSGNDMPFVNVTWAKSNFVNTLQMFLNDNATSILAYNDEPPPGARENTTTSAHAKGLVVFINETSVVWIVHSIPRFPLVVNSTLDVRALPAELKYGQMALITEILPVKVMAPWIAQFIQTVQPNFYFKRVNNNNIPEQVTAAFNNNKKTTATSASFSYGPYKFFAKSKHYQNDLYSSLVAPHILGPNQTMYIQTWLNGDGGVLPSDPEHNIYNIDVVRIAASAPISTHADHSKWALAVGVDTNYWCIGDLNRIESQFARGGQAICLSGEEFLHTIFLQAVISVTIPKPPLNKTFRDKEL